MAKDELVKIRPGVWLREPPLSIISYSGDQTLAIKPTVNMKGPGDANTSFSFDTKADANDYATHLATVCNEAFASPVTESPAPLTTEEAVCQAGLDALIERLQTTIDRVNVICHDYEQGGYADPGRTIDAIRDALNRRG